MRIMVALNAWNIAEDRTFFWPPSGLKTWNFDGDRLSEISHYSYHGGRKSHTWKQMEESGSLLKAQTSPWKSNFGQFRLIQDSGRFSHTSSAQLDWGPRPPFLKDHHAAQLWNFKLNFFFVPCVVLCAGLHAYLVLPTVPFQYEATSGRLFIVPRWARWRMKAGYR